MSIVDQMDKDCQIIYEELDDVETMVGDLYVTYFESPLHPFPKTHATSFRKSLERIREMIEQMEREVS